MDHKKLRCALLGSAVVSVALFSTPCVSGSSEVSAAAKQMGSSVEGTVKKGAQTAGAKAANTGKKAKNNVTGTRSKKDLDKKYKDIKTKAQCQEAYDKIKKRSGKSGITGTAKNHTSGNPDKLRYLEAKCASLEK